MKKEYYTNLLIKLEKALNRSYLNKKSTVTLNHWELLDLVSLWREESIKKWSIK